MKTDKGKKEDIPFNRTYWVAPGRFLAGCYPGSEEKDKAYQQLKALLDHGIRHVINLMEPDESNWDMKPFVPYEDKLKSIAESMDVEVTFNRSPIRDMRVSSRGEMIQILNRIDQSIEGGKPVYIHCWGGRGRTGTVVGCYLARHGFATDCNVLKLIQQLRRNTEDRDRPSPQTSQQIEMVQAWRDR